MSQNAAQVQSLREMFNKMKMAFTQVPPHPSHMPPEAMPPQGMPPQGMPPQGMPPQGMPPQGMPPQGMPPQGMPPQGMPPDAGAPPDVMEILDGVVGKIEQISQESNQRIQGLEQTVSQLQNELAQERAVREERKKLIEAVGI